jgi:hypothetical protein
MEPTTAVAIATAMGKALEGLGKYLGEREKTKVEKKKVKEIKRKTFADLLNESLNRSHDLGKDVRRSQGEFAGARAKAMQDTAAGIRQSLIR